MPIKPPAKLTEKQIALLKEPHLAQLVTINKDGSAHIAPLWIDTDGTHIIVNTADGRVKVRNIRRDPRVAVGIFDAAKSYSRVLNVQGRVVEITREGADDHINAMSEKYLKRQYANIDPAHPRLIVKIIPEKINGRMD